MKYESRAIIKNVAQQGECKRHVNCDDVAVNAVSSQQPFPCLALPGLAFALSCPALPYPGLPYFASFFSHFATETFWYFLSTDADEFVCSSSFVVPALTKFVERESLVEFIFCCYSSFPTVFRLLLLLSTSQKRCACDYAVKTFPAPPFCIAKRGQLKLGCSTGDVRKVSELTAWLNASGAKATRKTPMREDRLRDWGRQRERESMRVKFSHSNSKLMQLQKHFSAAFSHKVG